MYDEEGAEQRIGVEESAATLEDKIQQWIMIIVVLLFWLLPIAYLWWCG